MFALHLKVKTVLFSALFLYGCSWNEPVKVEDDFGHSVKAMIAGQLFDPAIAASPNALAPDTIDGETADSTIKSYRTAAEQARTQRSRNTSSPIPVVGTTTGNE